MQIIASNPPASSAEAFATLAPIVVHYAALQQYVLLQLQQCNTNEEISWTLVGVCFIR